MRTERRTQGCGSIGIARLPPLVSFLVRYIDHRQHLTLTCPSAGPSTLQGIQVQHYVTSHGFALNCSTDLAWFSHIVACGLSDKDTTSITSELARQRMLTCDVSVENVVPILCRTFGKVFGRRVVPLTE